MRRTLLAFCLAIVSLAATAQTTFGVKGGLNLTKFIYDLGTLQDAFYSSSFLPTFSAGVFADIKTGRSISIQPALLLSVKGANISSGGLLSGGHSDIDTKRKVNYLHLPVNILYNKPLGNNTLFFGFGPFVSYALNGKDNGTITAVQNPPFTKTTTTVKEDVEFNDAYNGMKRWDTGVEFLAGFKFSNGLLFNVNYDLGLTNIDKSFPKTRTSVLGVSVGYAFQ